METLKWEWKGWNFPICRMKTLIEFIQKKKNISSDFTLKFFVCLSFILVEIIKDYRDGMRYDPYSLKKENFENLRNWNLGKTKKKTNEKTQTKKLKMKKQTKIYRERITRSDHFESIRSFMSPSITTISSSPSVEDTKFYQL